MPKTLSATEVKTRFGSVMGWVLENHDEVIVESRGEPKVVVITYDEYEKLCEMKEQEWRREALARLEAVRERVQAKNAGITAEEAEVVADEITRGAIESLVRKGKVTFSE